MEMEAKDPTYNMNQIREAEYRSTMEPRGILNHRPEDKIEKERSVSFAAPPAYPPKPPANVLPAKKPRKPRKENTRRARKYVHVSESMKYLHMDQYPGSKRKSSPLEKCPICKKYFRRMKTHLLKHSDMVGKPGDPLTCQYCNRVFNSASNLSIHLRTHTGDKPYVCEVCSKGFAQSCNLVNHMRIHTGERPFKCPHCERAFSQSGNLSNHIRLHTDEKPFKCHFCDRAFTQSGNLNSHIKNNHREFYDNPELYPL